MRQSPRRPLAPGRVLNIAALFVDSKGIYASMPGIDAWPESRDALRYCGPDPVVAHPPCQLWGAFAEINYTRWGGEHNKPGNDAGCFEHALACVLAFGGVLEHPAASRAWASYGLQKPAAGKWSCSSICGYSYWVCEVCQSVYGHKARKRTWLLYSGVSDPIDADWRVVPGTHQCGYHDQRGVDRNKPTLGKREASATPIAFAAFLISLARGCRA